MPSLDNFFSIIEMKLVPGGTLFFDIINKKSLTTLVKIILSPKWRDNNVTFYSIGDIKTKCNLKNLTISSVDGVYMLGVSKKFIPKKGFLLKLAIRFENILNLLYVFKHFFSYRVIFTASSSNAKI